MGDHYGRTVLHQVLQRFLYQTFGFRIQGGCGLIQDQDRGILQDRTGDTDSLALSTRQFSTSVTYIGIVTFLTRYDKIVSVSDAGGFLHLFHRSSFHSKSDIVEEGIVKQDSLLIDISHQSPKIEKGGLTDIRIINTNIPFIHIIKARQ